MSTYKKSKALLDTFVAITVVADSKETAEEAIDNAFDVIEKFGELINFYSDKSELSAVNRNAGIREVKVSPETLDIIEKAVYIAERSGGAFDPTIGPEIQLWDFFNKIRPSDADIRKNLSLVNYKNIIIDKGNSTVFLKKKDMLLDLGGIAKGYAADLAVQALKEKGISAGLVAVAGDIKAFGLKTDKKPWTVGIKNPRQKSSEDEIIAKIHLSGKAISTSGDYERYFMLNGQRFHHLLNPRTGYPAYACQSVSVIADQAVMTDAFSTALFILGPEKGLELAKEMGIDALIIDDKSSVHTTSGLEGILFLERNH
ncbi:MAG: FAD:protein FMN transferase [Nitrospirota bacterium]|nr:FAD:protein FMN transferase [Nitrospirota bacterium]